MNASSPSPATEVDRTYGLDPVLETGRDARFIELSRFVGVPCPYCGGSYETAIDLTLGKQEYIEDCQVCCRSIELAVDVANGVLKNFTARRVDDVS